MLNDGILYLEPGGISMFGHYERFDSVEAWLWYIDGCPDGRSKYIKGIVDMYGG